MLYRGYEIKEGTLKTKHSSKTAAGGIHDPRTGELLTLCETVKLAKMHIDDRTRRGIPIGPGKEVAKA